MPRVVSGTKVQLIRPYVLDQTSRRPRALELSIGVTRAVDRACWSRLVKVS